MRNIFHIGDPTPWKYFLGVSVALGILFAALEPEGTTDSGVMASLFQWLAQTMIPMALCIAAHITLHLSAPFDRLDPWFKLVVSGCFGAILFSPLAYGIDLLLGENPVSGTLHIAEWLDELGAVIVPVAFTWVVINAPFQLGYSFRREVNTAPMGTPNPSPPTPSAPASESFFLSLIPEARRGEVIHMKSELHYLSVTTPKGRSLILYTLRDAIRELPSDTGFQTHRSHWANLAHVKDFEVEGRLATLTMSDGAKVPVSRSKVKQLKALLGRPG